MHWLYLLEHHVFLLLLLILVYGSVSMYID
jgi:hypothetical protein